jgi:hypothetical protein
MYDAGELDTKMYLREIERQVAAARRQSAPRLPDAARSGAWRAVGLWLLRLRRIARPRRAA